MSGFVARLERLELKNLIDELAAERMRCAIGVRCRPDPHNANTRPAEPKRIARGFCWKMLLDQIWYGRAES
jgi:hypothetical protein